jgi:hypothetical protein
MKMNAARNESLETADTWRAYRRAFDDFAQRVQQLQWLTAQPNPDRAVLEAARFELERARAVYNICRDALAQPLLQSSTRDAFPSGAPASPRYASHVSGIAQLLWEVGDRLEGMADEDWYRAEEIVRRAATVQTLLWPVPQLNCPPLHPRAAR